MFVDACETYGGSQFVDSPGMGAYHSYLGDEVVPWVDAHHRTAPRPEHRRITGKSSGGFGADVTQMLRPDLFGGIASHAGDALYEYCYLPEAAQVVLALRPYDGGLQAWWTDFRGRTAITKPTDGMLLSALGLLGHVLRRPGRRPGAAPRPAQRAGAGGRMGAVAGLGPGAHGPAPRRRAARPEGDPDRRRQSRPVLPRPGRARPSSTHAKVGVTDVHH